MKTSHIDAVKITNTSFTVIIIIIIIIIIIGSSSIYNTIN